MNIKQITNILRSLLMKDMKNEEKRVSFEKKPPVEPSVVVLWRYKKNKDYFADGVVVLVQNGKGLLREEYVNNYMGKSACTLMFGDKPLFQLQGDEYFCPTCEKIVKSGYNLEQTDEFSFEAINAGGADFGMVVEQMKPLLGLLPDGVYCLWDTALYPTDGNGQLFWDYTNDNIPKDGSCIYYIGNGRYASMLPLFTCATQPRRLYNAERTEFYREKKGSRAIAYYCDGNMTALLDGHHKAMAAALEHRQVSSVVISKCHVGKRYIDRKVVETILSANDATFPVEKLGVAEDMLDALCNRTPIKSTYYPISWTDEDVLPVDTKELASFYPSVAECACISQFDEINDELIDYYIDCAATGDKDELMCLIRALGALQNRRLFELVDTILHSSYDNDVLLCAVKQIAKQMERGDNMGVPDMQEYLIGCMVDIEDEHPIVGREILSLL